MFDWTREDGIEIPQKEILRAIEDLEAKTVKMIRVNPYELVTKVGPWNAGFSDSQKKGKDER